MTKKQKHDLIKTCVIEAIFYGNLNHAMQFPSIAGYVLVAAGIVKIDNDNTALVNTFDTYEEFEEECETISNNRAKRVIVWAKGALEKARAYFKKFGGWDKLYNVKLVKPKKIFDVKDVIKYLEKHELSEQAKEILLYAKALQE